MCYFGVYFKIRREGVERVDYHRYICFTFVTYSLSISQNYSFYFILAVRGVRSSYRSMHCKGHFWQHIAQVQSQRESSELFPGLSAETIGRRGYSSTSSICLLFDNLLFCTVALLFLLGCNEDTLKVHRMALLVGRDHQIIYSSLQLTLAAMAEI